MSASAGESSQAQGSGTTLGVPGQTTDTQGSNSLSGETTSETATTSRAGSKRSLNGKRRDPSTGSKRVAMPSEEKSTRPVSDEPSQLDASVKPKKKKGLLAFLCCSSDSQDSAAQDQLPPKPVVTPATERLSQSVPDRTDLNAGSASTRGRNTTDANDEKLAVKQEAQPTTKRLSGAATDKPVPDLPAEATAASDNVSQTSSQRQIVPNTTLGIVPLVVTPEPAGATAADGTGPTVEVQPPTPIGQTDSEDIPIADRTPAQKAQDENIELSDTNPKIPLSEEEADQITNQQQANAETQAATIPPPPPLAERNVDGSVNSHEISETGQKWLLPPVRPEHKGRKCLVLDLDETLVHSSFKVRFLSAWCIKSATNPYIQILHQADMTIPVEIEGQYHNVYVIKRPGVDTFLKRVGELYEVVVFTASVSKYGDPLLDQLDIHNVVHHRLFRESCYNHQGNYVKDLSQVGRDLKDTIIIDNSPTSYIFHPQHAVPISSWFSDAHDNELLDLIPVLEDLAGSQVQDVSLVLDVAL